MCEGQEKSGARFKHSEHVNDGISISEFQLTYDSSGDSMGWGSQSSSNSSRNAADMRNPSELVSGEDRNYNKHGSSTLLS